MMVDVINAIVSWPMFFVVTVLVFQKPLRNLIQRIADSEGAKAKFSGFEIEIGKAAQVCKNAADILNKTNVVMARTRKLEFEIIREKYAPVIAKSQMDQIKQYIDELDGLTKQAEEYLKK